MAVHVDDLCTRVSDFLRDVRHAFDHDSSAPFSERMKTAEIHVGIAREEFSKWCQENGLDVDFTEKT